MVTATLMGGSPGRLLRSSDPVERTVEAVVISEAFNRWTKLSEARIHMLANEVAKRFGGH